MYVKLNSCVLDHRLIKGPTLYSTYFVIFVCSSFANIFGLFIKIYQTLSLSLENNCVESRLLGLCNLYVDIMLAQKFNTLRVFTVAWCEKDAFSKWTILKFFLDQVRLPTNSIWTLDNINKNYIETTYWTIELK